MPSFVETGGGGDIPFGYPKQYTLFAGTNGSEVEQTGLIFWRLVEVTNEISQLEVTIGDVASDDTNVARGKYLRLYSENDLMFKGIIQEVGYDTYGLCKVVALETSILLRNRQVSTLDSTNPSSTEGRQQYDNVSTGTIISELASSNGDGASPWIVNVDSTDSGSAYGNISMRFENTNRLDAISGLANAIDYNWWMDYGAFPWDTNYIHIKSERGTSADSKYTFDTNNIMNVDRILDVENLANVVTVLGYGDGINQAKTEIFAASTYYSTITTNITAAGTTLAVLDTTGLAAGDKIIVGTEVMDIDSVDSGTQLTVSRGGDDVDSDATTALKHNSGCIIFQYYDAGTTTYYTKTSPQTSSSIDTYGLNEFIYEDKTLILDSDKISVEVLELIASKLILERFAPIERIELTPTEQYEVDAAIRVGEYATITDSNTGLTGTYKLAKRECGLTETEGYFYKLYFSNARLLYTNETNSLRKAQSAQAIVAQGATNIYAVSAYDNCENAATKYLDMRFFIPNEAIAINKVLLNFKRKDFRAYSTSLSHTHSLNGITSNASSTMSLVQETTFGTNDTITTSFATVATITRSAVAVAFVGCTFNLQNNTPANRQFFSRIYNSTDGTYSPSSTGMYSSGLQVDIDGSGWGNNSGGFFFLGADTASDTIYLQHKATGSSGSVYTSGAWICLGTHTHDFGAVSTASGGSSYGIDVTAGGASSNVDLYIGEDGGSMTKKATYSADQTELDVTDEVKAVGAGKWVDLQFRPAAKMRIEANAYIQIFIESK